MTYSFMERQMVVDDSDAKVGDPTDNGDEHDDQEVLDVQPPEIEEVDEFFEITEPDPTAVPVKAITEYEPSAPPEKLADTEHKHEQKFRWWALGVIAALCVFFGLATLLVASLASGDAAIQVASDIAKFSIPTLLTLLGTAVAWAFKSEKD